MIETLSYPSKDNLVSARAELLVIGVQSAMQGKGIGSKLISALEEQYINRNIERYKVSVHKSRKNAIIFYENQGFQEAAEFTLYQKEWLIYLKEPAAGIGT